jgi:predicted NBD/HSP70 family sugar kinase
VRAPPFRVVIDVTVRSPDQQGRGAAPQPGSLEALRETNRRRVIGVLRETGTASRAEIARRTGLSRSTVSSVVADLIAAGLAREGEAVVTRGARGTGRPAVPITLDPSAGVALGIDLSHDGIRVVLSDLAHEVLQERWGEADVVGMGAEEVLSLVGDTVHRALEATGTPTERLVGAALAVPAPIDPDSGHLGAESVIPSLAGFDLAGHLSARFGFRVRAENDANLCALAELLWGVGAGHQNAVYVKLSRGIGAGLVIGGRLYRGVHGGAGEIGHTAVVPEGPVCRCGNRGCLEVMAGTGAVIGLVSGRFDRIPSIPEVVERAVGGDTLCRRALRDVGGMVGTALAAVTNLLNPSLVVIGGELVTAWRMMEVPMREAMDRGAIHRSAADVAVLPSTLGRRAEALGAVALVLRESQDLAHAAA